MNIITFRDGTEYFTASDIVSHAISHGYRPHISTDNRLHPGSMCNRFMHQIIMNQAMRRYYNVDESSVIKISATKNPLVVSKIVNACGLSSKSVVNDFLQLYNVNATKALLGFLLNRTDCYPTEKELVNVQINGVVEYESKTVERKKERPKINLFKKN